jgi:hypothetical protein
VIQWLKSFSQPKDTRFDPFLQKQKNKNSWMKLMKKIAYMQFLQARCPGKKSILPREKETKW